jgi:hypothetical protein
VDRAAERLTLKRHAVQRDDLAGLPAVVVRRTPEDDDSVFRPRYVETSGEIKVRARAAERRGSVRRLEWRSGRDDGQLSDENDSHHDQNPFGLDFGLAGRNRPNSAQVRKK